MPWFKGNLHCHSTNSDGHSAPPDVARYYREIGMDFVTISDHDRLTSLAEYAEVLSPEFVGIPCCEYSGQKCSHVVAVDVDVAVKPEEDQSSWEVRDILQDGIDRTVAAGGVPIVCHPTWQWTYDHTTILNLSGVTHFEVFNASPDCNSYPVAGSSPTEDIWDQVLTAGRRLFGVATDDAHWHGSPADAKTPPRRLAMGGLGWVVVKAPANDRGLLRRAFEAGHFYSSSGIELSEYRVTSETIEVTVQPATDERIVIEFIGSQGRLLHRQTGAAAAYLFEDDEAYVRVRVSNTNGCYALTQPVFADDRDEAIAWTSQP